MPWVSDVRAVVADGSATLDSPAPRLGQICAIVVATMVVFVVLVRAFDFGPYVAGAFLMLGAMVAALSICSKSFRTRFDRAAGSVTVEMRSPCGHSRQEYPFAEIDALAVTEGCVVELQLRDGTTRRLTYAHETYPQLDKMISSVCSATGIAKGSPSAARAPFQDNEGVLSEPGMGLYVEGRFAILATSSKMLSFRWVMEIVFNRGRREMTVIRTTPLGKSRELIPLQVVSSIGLDGMRDAETGEYSYRPVIRLDKGRNIRMFGETRSYPRYDRILGKVRDLTGIAKQDNVHSPHDDYWPSRWSKGESRES
jgi:hypothetical protein